MRLHRLQLTNFCQFRKLEIDFASGLNAIKGPNGAGKSNIMTAVVFALLGDFSRNPGVKADNICKLAGSKDKSSVVLEISHGQAKAVITRSLRPASQSLKIEGEEKPWTRDAEITEKLSSILGVNERLLNDYVFVAQWKLFDFINQSATVRVKAFGELFDADKADKIHRAIGDDKIVIPVPTIDADKIRVIVSQEQNEVSNLVAKMQNEYSDVPANWKRDNDPYYRILTDYRHSLDYLARKLKLENDLSAYKSTLATTNAAHASAVDIVAKLTQALSDNEDEYSSTKIELANWQTYETVNNLRKSLQDKLDDINSLPDLWPGSLPEPDSYLTVSDRARYEEVIINDKADIKWYDTLIANFANQCSSVCPTCGTPVTLIQTTLDRAKVDRAKLLTEVEKLTAEIDSSNRWDSYKLQLETEDKRRTTEKDNITDRLSCLDSVPRPVKDKLVLSKIMQQYTDKQRELIVAQTNLQNQHNAKIKLESLVGVLARQLVDVETEIAKCNVTQQQANDAEHYLNQMDRRYSEKLSLQLKLEALEKSIKIRKDDLDKCAAEEHQARKLRRHVEHMEGVKGVVKQLPVVAAQTCLEELWPEIDAVLERFDAPFRIHAVSNLRFVVKKHNGIIEPAERLSGGEKVVFALAFRIAVNSNYAGQLGLLCLDEPTAGLDDDNLGCLEIALGRLRELSHSRGLQVILITHESGIDSLFDRVIKLSPAQ
jgi:DNA repair exonuclease SbcCD ATPase subunit